MRPVEDILPHRPPFLFVDEVLSMDERRITARRMVRLDEPHFAGHYPKRPIMPGVLLCETVVQAGAYLVATLIGEDADMKGVPVLGRLDKVKFKTMIVPGDELLIEAEYIGGRLGAHMMTGRIHVAGKLACELDFTLKLVRDEE